MAVEKIKESFSIFKQADYKVFTRFGFITSILIIVIFAGIHLVKIELFGFKIEGDFVEFVFNIVLSLISALLFIVLTTFIGKNFGPRLASFIISNKILKIVLTKGDTHYFEKLGKTERKVKPPMAINKFINLLLSWTAVTAFLIGTILPFFDFLLVGFGNTLTDKNRIVRFLTADLSKPDDLMFYLLKIIFVLILTPFFLQIVIPIPWMLNDAHLKSYSTGLRINFMVGRLIQQRVASLFAIGGIVSLIVVTGADPNVILGLLSFILLFVALPAALATFLYNLLFQLEYYDELLRVVPAPVGITLVQFESKESLLSEQQQQDLEMSQEPKEESDSTDTSVQEGDEQASETENTEKIQDSQKDEADS